MRDTTERARQEHWSCISTGIFITLIVAVVVSGSGVTTLLLFGGFVAIDGRSCRCGVVAAVIAATIDVDTGGSRTKRNAGVVRSLR